MEATFPYRTLRCPHDIRLLPAIPPPPNDDGSPTAPSVGPPSQNIKIAERTQSGRAYAQADRGIDLGQHQVLCAMFVPAVARAVRLALHRVLGGGVLATTDPAAVLRSPLTHKPCACPQGPLTT